jgi:ArsR family transcriptional regulator
MSACDCHAIHEEAVGRVRAVMPRHDEFLNLADSHKILSDATRLKILWSLSREDLCVCDLAVLLGMTKSAVSHQLKSLRTANLVKADKQGKIVFYSLVRTELMSDHIINVSV